MARWRRFVDGGTGLAEAISSRLWRFRVSVFRWVAALDYVLWLLGAEFMFRLKPILQFVTRRPIPRDIYFVCPLANLFGRWLGLQSLFWRFLCTCGFDTCCWAHFLPPIRVASVLRMPANANRYSFLTWLVAGEFEDI